MIYPSEEVGVSAVFGRYMENSLDVASSGD